MDDNNQPTLEESKEIIRKNLKVVENIFGVYEVPNGHEFERQLKEEVERQRVIAVAEAALTIASNNEAIAITDTENQIINTICEDCCFEITDEDDDD
jgi:hypothetical protein